MRSDNTGSDVADPRLQQLHQIAHSEKMFRIL